MMCHGKAVEYNPVSGSVVELAQMVVENRTHKNQGCVCVYFTDGELLSLKGMHAVLCK